MGDKNINIKTSTVAPPAKKQEEADSYQKSAVSTPSEDNFGSGGSGYQEKDAKSVKWGIMKKGSPDFGGLAENDPMAIVGQFCEEKNSQLSSKVPPDKYQFIPKNAFELFRMHYEKPDQTREVDLEAVVPYIPPFSELKAGIEDLELIEGYYMNRLGAIENLMAHTESILETSSHAHELHARHDFHKFLEGKKEFIMNELVFLYQEKLTAG